MTFSQVVMHLSEMVSFKRKQQVAYAIKVGLTIVILGVLGTASYFGYRWYAISREQNAQKLLGEYINEFQQATRSDNEQTWADTGSLFKLGYDHQAGTKTSVYFLGFQADALVRQGKRVQAVAVLDTMINQLGTNPITPLFKLKRALIKLDIKDDTVVEQGLKELTALAADKQNTNRDVAQFYLGNYYWTQNKLDEAKNAWQQLIQDAHEGKPPYSSWVPLAEQKLAQIS